jgi:hypothetical protein
MGFKEICSKPIALAVDLLSSRAKLSQNILGRDFDRKKAN